MMLTVASATAGIGLVCGLVGLLFAVIGVGLIRLGPRRRARRAAFAARARSVPGEVIDVRWHGQIGRAPNAEVTMLGYPVLRYALPDGSTVEQESFEGASPPVVKAGEQVTVLYDPDRPQRARVSKEGVANRVVPAALMVAGVGALLLGALLIAIGALLA